MKKDFKIRKRTVFFLTVFHAGAVVALFYFSWQLLIMTMVLWYMSHCLGLGVGFHRLLTHWAFPASKATEYVLTILGLLTAEGGAIHWVVTHRIHHAYADKPGDPHTPRDGGWWSHWIWVVRMDPKLRDPATLEKYAPDLWKSGFHRTMDKCWWLPILILVVVLYFAGGPGAVLWGVFFRITVGLHFTWLVNSATHMWGKRRFDTKDDSRNNWWVALLTWGEGWHNNHHAHPRAPWHGIAWYEVDPSGRMIWVQQKARRLWSAIATKLKTFAKLETS